MRLEGKHFIFFLRKASTGIWRRRENQQTFLYGEGLIGCYNMADDEVVTMIISPDFISGFIQANSVCYQIYYA